MKIQRLQQAFSPEELCQGAELVLSGEVKCNAQPLSSAQVLYGYSSCFEDHRIMELKTEFKEYVQQRQNKNTAVLHFDCDRERVLKSTCSCDTFLKDRYGCPHTAAALVSYYLDQEGEDFFRGTSLEKSLRNLAMVEDPFAPGVMKRTDSRILQFFKDIQEDSSLPVWEEKKPVKIKQQIHLDYAVLQVMDQFYVELKAGPSRTYVVKNLPAFLKTYEEEGLYPFGKESLPLSVESCDDFANSLLRILTDARKEEEKNDISMSASRFCSIGTSKDLRYFRLGIYDLGKLLTLVDGKNLKMSDGRELPVRLNRKGLELILRKKAHGVSMTIKEVEVLIPIEVGTIYLQDQKGIFSVTAYNLEEMAMLQTLIQIKGSLYIRESDISSLRRQILPVFERYGKVFVKGLDLDNYDREKPHIDLYLDLEDANTISCRPYAVYENPDASFPLFDNSEGTQRRNGEVEKNCAQELSRLFTTYDQGQDKLMAVYPEEQLYDFLKKTVPQLKKEYNLYITDRMKRLKIRKLPTLQSHISVRGKEIIMNLKGGNLSQQEMSEILANYSSKTRYFRLKDGSFFNFEDSDSQVWDTMAELYKHNGSKDPSLMKIPLYRSLYISDMLKDRDGLILEEDDHYRKLVESMEQSDRQIEVPGSLAKILRPYQAEGFGWIKRLKGFGFGGILADDMGLGKTLQILAFLLSEKEKRIRNKETPLDTETGAVSGTSRPSLIICPASLVYNWQKEIRRFTPELTSVVIAGTQSVRRDLIGNSSDIDVWITSYDLLKRDISFYEGCTFENQIIDEAQFIKNQNTQAAQAVRIISADFRMALTGTPIENRLGELWSIMDYLMPGFLYTSGRFQKEYELPILDNPEGPAMQRLRTMVHPFILRRLKKEVLRDLPDKIEETITVRLDGNQKKLYQAHASNLRLSLEKKSNEEFRSQKIQILAELTRLRQLCCDPSLLYEDYTGESAKLDACMELVTQAHEGGHKVLIFSQFTTMLNIICDRITREGLSYHRIDGSVSKEKRMEMVDSFESDDVPIFCISLKAGGTGLNLTAADIVIHYDPWWNKAAQNQATDRAHRIGQTRNVSVYELIAEDTIEEQIQSIKDSKAQLMEDVLSGESISATSIDREQLLGLLK